MRVRSRTFDAATIDPDEGEQGEQIIVNRVELPVKLTGTQFANVFKPGLIWPDEVQPRIDAEVFTPDDPEITPYG